MAEKVPQTIAKSGTMSALGKTWSFVLGEKSVMNV